MKVAATPTVTHSCRNTIVMTCGRRLGWGWAGGELEGLRLPPQPLDAWCCRPERWLLLPRMLNSSCRLALPTKC